MRARWLVLAAVLFAASVAIACAAGTGSQLSGLDERLTDAFTARRTSEWNRVFWAFTVLGDSPILGALTGSATILLVAWGKRTAAAVTAGGVSVAFGMMHLAKVVVQRTRPQEALALVQQPDSYSLPSGHALVSLAFCGFLAYLVFRWIDGRRRRENRALWVAAKSAVAVVAAAAAALVGVSRVYLGVHWASDVFAGWCLGGAWLLVMIAVFAAGKRRGGGWGALDDSGPGGGRKVRVALAVVLTLIVAAVAVLTALADPLLA